MLLAASQVTIHLSRIHSDQKSADKNPDIAGVSADLGRLIIYKPSISTNANVLCKSYFKT